MNQWISAWFMTPWLFSELCKKSVNYWLAMKRFYSRVLCFLVWKTLWHNYGPRKSIYGLIQQWLHCNDTVCLSPDLNENDMNYFGYFSLLHPFVIIKAIKEFYCQLLDYNALVYILLKLFNILMYCLHFG